MFFSISADDRHPPLSQFTALGEIKPTAHAHVMMRDPLPVGQAAPQGVVRGRFVVVETVLRHGRMFQGSVEV